MYLDVQWESIQSGSLSFLTTAPDPTRGGAQNTLGNASKTVISYGNPPIPPLACGSNFTVSSLLGEVWGGRRARALTVGARPRQAGARPERRRETPSKERNSGVAPSRQRRGRRQWRQPLNYRMVVEWSKCCDTCSDHSKAVNIGGLQPEFKTFFFVKFFLSLTVRLDSEILRSSVSLAHRH